MPSPLFEIPEIQENQSGKYITHNEALALLEGLITRVLSRTNGGPPGSTSEGDTYIVDSGTGDWSGASVDDIAHYYSGSWHFLSPVEGFDIWCQDEDGRIVYDGSNWAMKYASDISLDRTLSNEQGTGITDKMTIDVNSVGFGAALYVASDGHLEEAKGTGQSTMPCMALALETGTGSDKQILFWGRIRNDSWSWAQGGYVYVDTTSGQLTQSKPSSNGDVVQVVGVALTSSILFFNPSYVTVEIS